MFHRIPRTVFVASVITLGVVIVMVQMATYSKLRKQQQTPIGEMSASTVSRNKLYKKAMTTSALITLAFLLAWIPLMIGCLFVDWSGFDEQKSRPIIRSLGILGIAQSFSNAIIFKLRNMKFTLCLKVRQNV